MADRAEEQAPSRANLEDWLADNPGRMEDHDLGSYLLAQAQLRALEAPFIASMAVEAAPWVSPEVQLSCFVKQIQNSANVPYLSWTDTARLAVLQHLAPHFALHDVDGQLELHLAPGCRTGTFTLRGQPLRVSVKMAGEPLADALALVKLVLAAREFLGLGAFAGAYAYATAALLLLQSAPFQDALKAVLPSQGFTDPGEALVDLRYSCHETCLLVLEETMDLLLENGEAEEYAGARTLHGQALLAAVPDLPSAYFLLARLQLAEDNFEGALQTAMSGTEVADALRDRFFGARLRQLAAASLCCGGDTAGEGGRAHVGRLRELQREWEALEAAVAAWMPENCRGYGAGAGGLVGAFLGSLPSDSDDNTRVPNVTAEELSAMMGAVHLKEETGEQ